MLTSPAGPVTVGAALNFLDHQIEKFGGNVALDDDNWILFVVENANDEANGVARALLQDAPFTWDHGVSEDDAWQIYYIATAQRAEALHWIEDQRRRHQGRMRRPSPAQQQLFAELLESTMPHRLAQRLVEQRSLGQLGPGALDDPALVRSLLDRLHTREPLYYSAFQSLLTQHLIDLVVLLHQLIPEDVELANESMRGSLSHDPFLRTRQSAAAEIRNLLVRFHLINSLDQQKNTAIRNPYRAYFDIIEADGIVSLVVDGTVGTARAGQVLNAIRTVRRQYYFGEAIEQMNTQSPWVTDEIAQPLRFVKQRLELRREIPVLDGLYMLERALTA